MKNYPSYLALRLFADLMATGSLSRTASAFGMSPSTAGRHIGELKDFLGEPLFTRCRQGMLPTHRARELLPMVLQLINDFDGLRMRREFNPAEISREVRIGCVDNAPLSVFPNLIRDISRKAPGLCSCAQPISGSRFELLRQNVLDLVVSPMSAAPSENFHVLDLVRQRYVVVCGADHPLMRKYRQTGQPIETADILEHRFVDVALSNRKSGVVLLRHSVFPEFSRAASAVKSYYFISFIGATVGTELLMVLPENSARLFERLGQAVILPTAAKSVEHVTKMIWHETTHNDLVMQWVRAMMVSSAIASSRQAPPMGDGA